MNTSTSRRVSLVVYVTIAVQVAAILYSLSQRPEPGLGMVLRGAALLGYTGLFWLVLSSEYMREMRKAFGQPFLKVHHRLAVATWLLIASHPLTFAVLNSDLAVLVPILSPFRSFLQWGGRTALYLLALATLAGLLRKSIKARWKIVHWLNYLAFFLIFIHAWLIGTDLSSSLLRILWAAMAGIVLAVFVHKRIK